MDDVCGGLWGGDGMMGFGVGAGAGLRLLWVLHNDLAGRFKVKNVYILRSFWAVFRRIGKGVREER